MSDNPLPFSQEIHQGADGQARILEYIRAFPSIVLYGAGALGRFVVDFLLENGVEAEKISYWDARAKNLREIDGIPVCLPFSQKNDPQHTLIIHCIKQPPSDILQACSDHGFSHFTDGKLLHEIFACPFSIGAGETLEICKKHAQCVFCRCPRACNGTWDVERDMGGGGGTFLVIFLFTC
jgi:hypothetical protein